VSGRYGSEWAVWEASRQRSGEQRKDKGRDEN
jgi:hypothetical protein